MYGDEAHRLALEAKRAQDRLIIYNEERVRAICREIRLLCEEADGLAQAIRSSLPPGHTDLRQTQDRGSLAALLMQYWTVNRNKRVLFAYHMRRIEHVKEWFWQVGQVPKPTQRLLSPSEVGFNKGYTAIVNAYKQNFTEIDLTAGLDPPKDLFIEVRVVKDCGEIQTEYGTLNLTMGNQLYVRRTDVERLIKQGYLVHV